MVAQPDRAVNVVLGQDGTVLVIRRHKDGRNYCVLPGGAIEPHEAPPDAALRELREETGLAGQIDGELWTLQHTDRIGHYFRTSVGSALLRLGGPEKDAQSSSNWHEPAWIPLPALDAENLQPVEVRQLLIRLAAD